jgi:hypothetical protein
MRDPVIASLAAGAFWKSTFVPPDVKGKASFPVTAGLEGVEKSLPAPQ